MDERKTDFREELTNKLIEHMEQGEIPWRKGWRDNPGAPGLPVNAISGKPYQGGNRLQLLMMSMSHDGREYTWKQAEARLGLLYGKSFVVFNVQQCQDLSIEAKGEPAIPGNEKAHNIIEGMKRDGVSLAHQGNRAFYRSSADLVVMPEPQQFVSPEEYMGTLLHELGHATGHENRMGRQLGNGFGSPEYAREELVAELTSVFTQAETGIAFDDKNHAAYIGSWMEALKKDKNEIFRAAKEASQAADYLIDRGRVVEKELAVGKEQEAGEKREVFDAERELRELWTKQGVSADRQDESIAQIAAKAAPGAQVGPFQIGGHVPGRHFESEPEMEMER